MHLLTPVPPFQIVLDQPKLRRAAAGRGGFEVSFQGLGSSYVVYSSESVEYCGLLDPDASKCVQVVETTPSLRFNASFNPSSKVLKFVIYGKIEHAQDVGRILASSDLFLQHPSLEEYDGWSYFNPHYLTRPGSTFQDILEAAQHDARQRKYLTLAEKSNVATALDSASGPTTFSEVEVSRSLRTELMSYDFTTHQMKKLYALTSLRRHQKKALAMMAEKESGNLSNPQFPLLWVESEIFGSSGPTL